MLEKMTNICKGRDGWEMTTFIKIADDRYFKLRTARNFLKHILTSATAVKVEGELIFSTCQDWYEIVRDVSKVRLTEQLIRDEHAAALEEEKLQSLLERCKKHYGIE